MEKPVRGSVFNSTFEGLKSNALKLLKLYDFDHILDDLKKIKHLSPSYYWDITTLDLRGNLDYKNPMIKISVLLKDDQSFFEKFMHFKASMLAFAEHFKIPKEMYEFTFVKQTSPTNFFRVDFCIFSPFRAVNIKEHAEPLVCRLSRHQIMQIKMKLDDLEIPNFDFWNKVRVKEDIHYWVEPHIVIPDTSIDTISKVRQILTELNINPDTLFYYWDYANEDLNLVVGSFGSIGFLDKIHNKNPFVQSKEGKILAGTRAELLFGYLKKKAEEYFKYYLSEEKVFWPNPSVFFRRVIKTVLRYDIYIPNTQDISHLNFSDYILASDFGSVLKQLNTFLEELLNKKRLYQLEREIYLGRDAVYMYIARRSYLLGKREFSRGKVKYIDFPRSFICYDKERARNVKEYLNSILGENISDVIFIDTGYHASVPCHILDMYSVESEDFKKHILMLDSDKNEFTIRSKREVQYTAVESLPKAFRKARGLYHLPSGKIKTFAPPVDFDEFISFAILSFVAAHHFYKKGLLEIKN